jgi:hypothetical protein
MHAYSFELLLFRICCVQHAIIICTIIITSTGLQISINHAFYNACREMSTENKNPFKRGQALNDATSGQLEEEPKADDDIPDSIREMENSRQKAARKISRDV